MKRGLATLVLLGLVAVLSVKAQMQILPAEPPHRPDAVVAGHLKVRVAAEYATSAYQVLEDLGLRVVREVLPSEQSLRFRESRQLRPRVARLDDAMDIEDRLLRSFVVAYEDNHIPPERKIEMLRIGCGPIECAAPWCVMELCGEPNDPEATKQGLLQSIRAIQAWDVEDGSDSVVIGISDSGVRQDHEDLKDALYVRTSEIPGNDIDDDANGYVDDYNGYSFSAKADGTAFSDTYNPNNGHGTSVAGTCGARVNNAVGIAGVANKCKIFPLRTMPNGTSGIVYGYESIIYCATNDIDVVNCSWGGQSRSCIDEDVVSYAIARGTAVVAAAGNHGLPTPFYPASYRGVFSVGVVDASDNVIPMSGHGPYVDVMAPGHGSWSTANDGTYSGFCCTSGSAPIAAAVVALVRSKHPELSPREACAIVRATATPSPWATIPPTTDPLLLPQGRIDALRAVSSNPNDLVSFVLDTTEVRGPLGAARWTVGDTIDVVLRLQNELSDATITQIRNIRLAGVNARGVALIGATNSSVDIDAGRGAFIELPPMTFVVTRATDTATYAVLTLVGTSKSGVPFEQTLSCAITPSPAFTTLSNSRVRISIGDRGRIGNTDIQRGQGEGLTFLSYCGQLYEGGLMVAANGRLVDNVRAERGINNHFGSTKGFVRPEPQYGIIEDHFAPDSLRIGVRIEQRVSLDTARALLLMDVTVTNVSDSALHDLAVGWFCDWDLGRQPADNSTYTLNDVQVIRSQHPTEPRVAQYVASTWSDALPILHGMDNTSTYGGFPWTRKAALLRGQESHFTGVNDVATVVGMRFTSPLPPGHVRNFQHVIAIDTSEQLALEQLRAGSEDVRAATKSPWIIRPIQEVFPNPATGVINIPVDGMGPSVEISIVDAHGRSVLRSDAAVPAGRAVVPLDAGMLAPGVYIVVVNDGPSSIHHKLVLRR
jgi:hypothetical protein